jgi:hypothetical protein
MSWALYQRVVEVYDLFWGATNVTDIFWFSLVVDVDCLGRRVDEQKKVFGLKKFVCGRTN